MKRNVEIRKAERQDVPLLLEFIRGIAQYEKMEKEVISLTRSRANEGMDGVSAGCSSIGTFVLTKCLH